MEFFFKQKARKPDFELTKPSTGQEYNESNTEKENQNKRPGLPAYKTAQEATEKEKGKLHYTS